MPLTDYEKSVLSDLLNNMEEDVIIRVARAVMGGNINPTTRAESYNYIMLHTESLDKLLGLNRVSKPVLLKYLHYLREDVPGTATKGEMLQRIRQKWNLPPAAPSYHAYSQTLAPMPSGHNTTAPVPANHYAYPQALAPMPTGHNPTASILTNHYAYPQALVTMPTGHNTAATIPANHYAYPHAPVPLDHQFEMMTAASHAIGMNHDPFSQMVKSKEVLKEIDKLAFEEYIVGFARTFYDLLNSPGGDGQWLHGFNDSHFFGECKLKIMIKAAAEDIEIEGEGIRDVLSSLSQLKREHQLHFSPNLTEKGVRSKTDTHGLVSAAVCGTLHQRSGPVGVFEQCFVLSTDPFAEQKTHKILETVLILRSANAVQSVAELMLMPDKKGEYNPTPKPTLAIKY